MPLPDARATHPAPPAPEAVAAAVRARFAALELADDTELVIEVLAAFRDDLASRRGSIALAREAGDWLSLARAAHALKGAAANLGADPLRARAADLEESARVLATGAEGVAAAADAAAPLDASIAAVEVAAAITVEGLALLVDDGEAR